MAGLVPDLPWLDANLIDILDCLRLPSLPNGQASSPCLSTPVDLGLQAAAGDYHRMKLPD